MQIELFTDIKFCKFFYYFLGVLKY
jgi:hypothetical protein